MFFMDLTQAAKNVARFMVRINLKAYYLVQYTNTMGLES